MSDIDYYTATYTGTVAIDAETLFLLTLAAQKLACNPQLPDNKREKYMSLYEKGHDAIVNGLCDGTVTLS